ncbi:MAG TPA: glycosyltransferase family 2 protein [Anaerolineae bacterium]|nr:glycosyltransferase family 2 protein [Anaerolineae bacterium]
MNHTYPACAVVILNWNNSSDTIATVQAIRAWPTYALAVWIVDNGSKDDSVERIRRECPSAHLLESNHNLGFAAGNNLAIRQALAENSTDYFLLLNNDAVIDEAGLRQMLATAEQHAAGIVGPVLRDPLPAATLQAAGGRNVAWHVDTHISDLPSDMEPYPVDYVPGTAILVRADLFTTIGLLDEAYFISGEIADFCLRAQRQGVRLLIDPGVTVYHDQGRSSELRLVFYAYYFLRNRFLFVRKFYPRLRWLLVPRWAFFGLVSVAASWLRGRQRRARALLLGLRHGLSGKFGDRSADVLALKE